MLNLDKVILENYNKKGVIVSDVEVRLASDRFIGFIDLLSKIKRRRDAELSQKSQSTTNFIESDILEEV